MVVVDVDWSPLQAPKVLNSGCFTLRLIYDSDFDKLCDNDQEYQIRCDFDKLISGDASKDRTICKITKHSVSSKCVAFHGLDNDSPFLFLRFGFSNSDGEESFIPRSKLLGDYLKENGFNESGDRGRSEVS